MVDDEDDVTAENSGPSGFAGNSSTARNMSTVQVPRHEERFEEVTRNLLLIVFTSFQKKMDDRIMDIEQDVRTIPEDTWITTYSSAAYQFPNDVTEIDRLNFQFEILKCVFNNRNYFAPLQDPKRILDVGTGTGQWAIEMGDEFPCAEVQGTDLSPIQPSSVPENVHFFIDDASDDDWVVPPDHFDYIHTRMLLGAFTDFKDIIRKSFYHLKPGGWMESQEVMTTPYCDDDTIPRDWPFMEWTRYSDKAAMEFGRPLRIANRLKKWYNEAGFVDVREEVFKLPINPWPDDKDLKVLGKVSEENLLAGLSGFSMAPFSRNLEWTKEEIEVYLVNVRKAISDQSVHAYHKIFVVWGRRPELLAPSG